MGAAAEDSADWASSARAPFTFASSAPAASPFSSSPPSLVGALASLESGFGPAGRIGRAGAAVRDVDLVALVEAGLVVEATGVCEVGVKGVSVPTWG